MCSNQEHLKAEVNRFITFTSWCELDECTKTELARFGFYFKQTPNIIKCTFCNLEMPYSPGDNCLREHLRWSPDCPLLNHQSTNNVPIDRELTDTILTAIGERSGAACYRPIQYRDNSYPESVQQIRRDDYNRLSQRLRSFKNWPNDNKPNAKKLGEAGFFYTGHHDQINCFSCGGALKNLNEYCDPWELHALWYENCNYLKNSKPISYIVNVKQKYQN